MSLDQGLDARLHSDAAAPVTLCLPAARGLSAAGRLVAGGVASRAGLDARQIRDLGLVVDTLLSGSTTQRSVTLELLEHTSGVTLRIGPLALRDNDRDLERALGAFTDRAGVEPSARGAWITVTLDRRSDARGS
jgi:hypothetical protein